LQPVDARPAATGVGADVPRVTVAETNGPHWLHPSSLLFEFLSAIRKQLIPAVIALYSAAQWGFYGLIFAIIFFAITMGVAILRFVTVRYQVRGNEFILDEGLVFRRHRTIPIQRIQNIDLVQSILHRLFRVAEVRIETASGKEPEAKLRVLSLHRIDELRSRVFEGASHDAAVARHDATARTTDAAQAAPPDGATAERILTIPPALLVKAGLLSNRGMVLVAVALGAIWQFSPWNNWDFDTRAVMKFIPFDQIVAHWVLTIVIVLLVLALLRLFSVAWYILRFHGYTLERRGEELRIHCGLFSRLSATVPRRRIQLISIQRTILGKAWGIASIRVETAGGSGSEGEDAASTISRRWFIPVLREADVARVIAELRPGIAWDEKHIAWLPPAPRAAARMRRIAIVLTVAISAVAWWFWSWPALLGGIGLAALATWYAGKKASVMRYARGDFGIAYRSGLLTKKCSLTFLEKVQSVWIHHSPFDRRWDMATLCLDTAGAGPANHKLHVHMLQADFARTEHAAIARLSSQKTIEFR
jgi:putative membrane protein